MPVSPAPPGPHPEPPPDLARRDLPLVASAGAWCRIHRITHQPDYFGRAARNRWDDPATQFGVLYLAEDEYGAFIETAGQPTGVGVVTRRWLIERAITQVTATRPLRLVDLTGPGLAQLGGDNRLCTGEHAVARRWSRALWAHPAAVDGLCYRARHDPSRCCVALFDRAAPALVFTPLKPLGNPGDDRWLAAVLDTYAFGLIE